jgi:hypothetical protein
MAHFGSAAGVADAGGPGLSAGAEGASAAGAFEEGAGEAAGAGLFVRYGQVDSFGTFGR